MNTVVQILDTITEEAARRDRTDGQLLDLFVRLRDEDAFATVVQRHGPMVLNVCRRVLRNAADADDAFQAAFLVLARKAATLETQHLLAQWLYGVAYNTARKLRQSITRRAIREQPLAGAAEPHTPNPEVRDELLAILDDELNRLPERYRSVIVLCDLEGHTRKETARLLVCPEGTVAGRLARARELLAARLAARGIAPAIGVLVAVLTERAATAAFSVKVASVVRAVAVDNLVSATATGLISRRVADTTEGVLKAMFLKNVRAVATSVLCCGLVLASAVSLFHFTSASAQPVPVPLLVDDPDQKPPVNPLAQLGLEPPPMPAPFNPLAQLGLEAPPKSAPSGPKNPTVIPLRTLDCKEVARTLSELFGPKFASVTPLPDDKAILVYADAKITKDIEAVLVKLGERVLMKPAVFHLDKKANCADTAKILAQVFGKARATFVAVPEDHVLLVYASEVDTLAVQKLLANVLAVEPAKAAESVVKSVTLKKRKAEEVAEIIRTLVGSRVQVIALKGQNQLLLSGPPDVIELAISIAVRIEESAPPETSAPPLIPGGLNPLAPAFDPRLVPRRFDPLDPGVDPHMVLPETKKFKFRMENAKWSDVLDWYSKASDLALITTVKPTGTFTFTSPKPGQEYTLGEITDLINEALMQQKFILVRRKTTFFIHPADERLDFTLVSQIELKDLPQRGRTEMVEVSIPLKNLDAAEAGEALRKLLTPFGEVVFAKGNRLVLRDTAGNITRILKTLEEFDKPAPPTTKTGPRGTPGGSDPRKGSPFGPGVDPRTAVPVAKTFTFHFKEVSWSNVLDWYAKESDLALITTVKPTGTFTFTPPKPGQLFTLAEVTDIINENLIAQKWLLVRGEKSFTVVPADEKIDSSFAPLVKLEELDRRGKYDLVRVLFQPKTQSLEDVADDVKKLLSPFGKVTVLFKVGGVEICDTAGKVRDIVKVLATAP